jgi:hypothetical protein
MYVLVACEESQRVCKAFRDKGHIAYSCDVIEASGGFPEWHIKQDVLPLLNGFCSFTTCDGVEHKLEQKWDLIIGHPPCTYLSVAGASRLYPKKGELDQERFQKGLEAKAFFMAIYNADCEKICVENPISLKIFEIPKHTQQIQPYEFGHPYSKKTRLWLKGLKPLIPTNIITEGVVSWVNAGSKKADGTQRTNSGVSHTAKERSKTFEGIALAMAEQWG